MGTNIMISIPDNEPLYSSLEVRVLNALWRVFGSEKGAGWMARQESPDELAMACEALASDDELDGLDPKEEILPYVSEWIKRFKENK